MDDTVWVEVRGHVFKMGDRVTVKPPTGGQRDTNTNMTGQVVGIRGQSHIYIDRLSLTTRTSWHYQVKFADENTREYSENQLEREENRAA